MIRLVFLLEEASMRSLLEPILPRILGEQVDCTLITHEGKQDLRRSMPRKIRGWGDPTARFVVLHDQDSHPDCRKLKAGLVSICKEAGAEAILVRIVCRELESWYLGDLAAVEKAFDMKGLRHLERKAKYRDPDHMVSPSREFKRLVPVYQKLMGARAMARFLDIEANRSKSLRAFVDGVRRLAGVERDPGS